MPGGPEILILLVVVLLIFGSSRLPKLARSLGQAKNELHEGMKDGKNNTVASCPGCGKEVTQTGERFCANCGSDLKAAASTNTDAA